MKSIFTLIFAIASVTFANARVLTVSNNPVNPGQYNNFSAANTAAVAGDTVYLHGSPTSYGSIFFTKSLTVIGVGHNPNKQNVQLSNVDHVTFQSNMSNVTIQGLTLLDVGYYNGSTSYDHYVNNVTFEYCNITGYANFQYNCTNWTFRNCYFSNSSSYNIIGQSSNSRSGLLIQNCIFNYGIYQLGTISNCLIVNNDFLSGYAITGTADGIVFSNNLIVGLFGFSGISISNSTITNNVYYISGSTLSMPTGSNNILQSNLLNTAPTFTSYVAGSVYTYAKNVRLTTGSVGKNAGTDGTDIGVYGGTSPFSNTGEPALPVMRTMNISNIVTPVGSALNVNFTSSKANPR
jgi:hypothetical protein